MAQVTLRKVIKKYDEVLAVRGIDLDITDKEFIVLVGPSGCGKTTTLRMIAGLEDITDGEILIGGDVVNDVPPKDRDIAMVFQNYALYPHMSVFDNLAFGLRRLGHLARLHAEGDVLLDGHRRVERVGLEHHGDVAVLGCHRVDQPPADANLAGGDAFEPGDHREQGGLAAAGGTDESNELAVARLQVDALEDLQGTVVLVNAGDVD